MLTAIRARDSTARSLKFCPKLVAYRITPRFDKGIINCADSDLPEWFKTNYVWTLDGKALSQSVTDMEPAVGNEEMGNFMFRKRND